MSVVQLDHWRPARAPAVPSHEAITGDINALADKLRLAGFEVAADLVAAAEIAIDQELVRRQAV